MHNIQDRDIQIGVKMAWHGLTKIVKKIELDKVEIRYPMATSPLFIEVAGNKVETDFKQIVSLDDNLPVGNPVGAKYNLLSNDQILEMIENSLTQVKHQVVSVGSVDNRSKVFASVSLDGNEHVKAGGRKTENVLNIMWGHGGNMPVIARSGFTVVVCQNTFNAALNARGDFNFRIKHTLNSGTKLENMEQAIDAHYGIVADFKLALDTMDAKPCDESRANRIVAGMLADGEEMSTRTANTVERVIQLYRGGAGNNGKTMADLFHGFTDYYSHESSGGDNTWKQYVSSEFGAGNRAKRGAFEILTSDVKTREMESKGAKSLALV